jgi:Response regulator containing a CheY-like receiver domain and an HTH DNA-binding domain
MVYIIDDTPSGQIEKLFNPVEWNDVLTVLKDISDEEIGNLSDPACIMIHSSFHNQTVKKKVMAAAGYGEDTPLVLFSDGDLPEAEFDGDSFITTYKKSEMYSKLPIFLRLYREAGEVNLKVLAEGEKAISKSTAADGDILLVGSNLSEAADAIGATIIPTPDTVLTSEKDVHDYVAKNLARPFSCLVLSLDENPALALDIAMHVRLSKDILNESILCSIVFVSEKPLGDFLGFAQSQLFLTEGMYFCPAACLNKTVKEARPLTKESYRSAFLNRISIARPEGSNHSLANQWGASRLYRIVSGKDITENEYKAFNNVQKELYYKFIMAKVSRASKGPETANIDQIPESHGKKVLLIDDEADKGWAKTIQAIFSATGFDPERDVICERVADYEGLSESGRNRIENGDYDLFLLDLRLNGDIEDNETEARKMSGYKVLSKIKKLNRGNQVIMLTASNKAWNLKALLDPLNGASGYFVKESPEYEFTDEFSIANLESFRNDARICFERGYLKRFRTLIDLISDKISKETDSDKKDFLREVNSQMDVAFGLCAQAASPSSYQYAYLSTFQVLEAIISHYVFENYNKTSGQRELWMHSDNGQDIPCSEVVRDNQKFISRIKPGKTFTTAKDHKVFGQRDKLSVLYLQKWGKQDDGFIYLLEQLILSRNDLIHKNEVSRVDNFRKIDFTRIFSYPDLNDESLFFHEKGVRDALNAASMNGQLYDNNGHIALGPDVSGSRVGVMLLLESLNKILPLL